MALLNTPPNAPVDDQGADGSLVNVSVSWRPWLVQVWVLLTGLTQSGTTANRPTSSLWTGRPYFDTTLGIPIWFDGADWIDATGTVV
jgi:hypothetical protein